MDIRVTGSQEPRMIKVLDGPAQGKTFFLEKREVTIGPGQDTDIHSPFEGIGEKASGERARITVKGNDCWLEDLGGGEGALVNGARIDKAVRLMVGSTFRLGQVTFQLIGSRVEREVLLKEEIVRTITT